MFCFSWRQKPKTFTSLLTPSPISTPSSFTALDLFSFAVYMTPHPSPLPSLESLLQ
jgi:hypothetical protein